LGTVGDSQTSGPAMSHGHEQTDLPDLDVRRYAPKAVEATQIDRSGRGEASLGWLE
jgi:hypothetical protein